MKTLIVVLALSSLSVSAQSYAIDWHSVDGGGGTSTGGVYSVSGTIGLPDAGAVAGGPYSMLGGFWAVAAISTAPAPALRIEATPSHVILAWPDPSTGFGLQETPGLSPPNWSDVTQEPTVVGTEKQVSLPWQPGSRFFRLHKP